MAAQVNQYQSMAPISQGPRPGGRNMNYNGPPPQPNSIVAYNQHPPMHPHGVSNVGARQDGPSQGGATVYRDGGDESAKRVKRLERNKEAARQCRVKKKEYIKCLESRVKNLEQQNLKLMKMIEDLRKTNSKPMSSKNNGSNADDNDRAAEKNDY
ncbi:hypothetical protein SARC_07034 [Sphaeroforma arctica JP610]|uniref:BZIP domain-containing protein n=1 Tax=Sphaeroforma arctica JP610 TaxID=667725 RepID=A0A0L0FVP4_9EUKA|nr:hypothetical protein SARC_07034 [Sphaeroforma arctica JP610]KNC80611.1 hypothetical protein SARC_07034 [Sphaeroforma arctica JP610]|eukprot:XP_014154513.1 hypothetical protein SARC_07034 [Sphaeroforma arctica JP610]